MKINLKTYIFIIVLITISSFKKPIQDDIKGSNPEISHRVIENNAFTFGEELNYRVHYGFINAAKIKLKVNSNPVEIMERQTYHLIADGKTNSTFDWMFKVRDRFESYIDMGYYAPLKYFKSVKEDRYSDVDLVFFDHEKKWIKGKKKNMDCPAYVQDIVGAIYYARTIDYNKAHKGDVFPINIYLDQEIYNLEFKYLGKETIKSDVGKVRCIKLMPKVVKDRVFKDDDAIVLWISDDDNKIPIRVDAKIYVGSLKVDLTSYKNLKNDFSSLK
ncbi:MAG: DUF3108 domain-containing protein [Bacteroidia bacterium]|nr:DUF3108 domain-containing protein [Bacteroidia bacterium]